MGYDPITSVRILEGTGRAPFAGSVRGEDRRIADLTPGPARSAAPQQPTRTSGWADVSSYELTRLILQERAAMRLIMKDGAIPRGVPASDPQGPRAAGE